MRKFPVNKLVAFNSYQEVKQWGSAEWTLNPDKVLGMFYQQAWAFAYFLNTYENGKYKKRFLKFFDLVMHGESGAKFGDRSFKDAFRIRDEDEWEELNEGFHAFIDDELSARIIRLAPTRFCFTNSGISQTAWANPEDGIKPATSRVLINSRLTPARF